MVAKLKPEDVNSQTDPSVSKQYDTETSTHDKFTDFYALADELKVCLLTTHRPGVGIVSRSMAVAKRQGPDFLFLANAHARKFDDLRGSKEVAVNFQKSGGAQDWASVSGVASVVSGGDPRIKELWNKGVKAWFGDLGDGVHTGGPEDPRVTLIEVRAGAIAHWKATTGGVGFLKETAVASVTGRVAQTGLLRELGPEECDKARGLAQV